MPLIEMYTRPGCGFCAAARQLLNDRGLPFTEFNVYVNSGYLEDMRTRTANKTYPQIFIDDRSIGGFEELVQLDSLGQLPKGDQSLPQQIAVNL